MSYPGGLVVFALTQSITYTAPIFVLSLPLALNTRQWLTIPLDFDTSLPIPLPTGVDDGGFSLLRLPPIRAALPSTLFVTQVGSGTGGGATLSTAPLATPGAAAAALGRSNASLFTLPSSWSATAEGGVRFPEGWAGLSDLVLSGCVADPTIDYYAWCNQQYYYG
jgi:hypothetical protein